jgi:hypothetical protein
MTCHEHRHRVACFASPHRLGVVIESDDLGPQVITAATNSPPQPASRSVPSGDLGPGRRVSTALRLQPLGPVQRKDFQFSPNAKRLL